MRTVNLWTTSVGVGLLASGLLACSGEGAGDPATTVGTAAQALGNRDVWYIPPAVNTGSRQLALQNSLRFNPLQPGSDADNGRRKFGASEDLTTEDKSEALFEGFSMAAMRVIESNQRTCFSCHRGADNGWGLPPPPLTDHIPEDDAIFTGFTADAQGDPRSLPTLRNKALIKYRPNRFNPQLPESEGLRQIFFWRKAPRLVNVAFNHGFLMDGRGRVMFEAVRGAVFTHTQPTDDRFDDLLPVPVANDMEAFQFGIVSDERLLALRDETHPLHETLKKRPFYTVDFETPRQVRGAAVFASQCMSCHNTPNVFNNISNVEPLGSGRPVTDPTFGPAVGRMFNIGVAERNKHGLDFRRWTGDGYEPIVVELAAENSPPVLHEVTTDIGLAATTARAEDIGRFKVPQLRGISDAAPYFHDNSAATLEEAVDYHLSDYYRNSRDGRNHPIDMNARQRRALLEFLRIL